MFSKLQIFHFENYEIKENDKYIYDCDLIIYLDANDNVINKDLNIINKHLKNFDLKYNKKLNMILINVRLMNKVI